MANQPVVVAIDASRDLMAYKPYEWDAPGIFRGECASEASLSSNLHAVLLVGYTQTYWILRNTWGPRSVGRWLWAQ